MIEDFDLSKVTTFHVGGKAKYYGEVSSREDLKKVAEFAKTRSLPILVLGEGSNVLISDKKFEGVVIRLVNKKITIKDDMVVCGAGMKWDDLVKICVDRNLYGIECMSGIPGTLGAAPVQNIGAYGQELGDVLVDLLVYDLRTNKLVKMTKRQCRFSYRNSVFKSPSNDGRYIIFEVRLKLNKGKFVANIKYDSLKKYFEDRKILTPGLVDVRKAVLSIRQEKLVDPKVYGNAGSFYKNPIVSLSTFKKIKNYYPNIPSHTVDDKSIKLFAGWLIETAGLKGKRIGDAAVSKKNSLVLVNMDSARSEDVYSLSKFIQRKVRNKFNVILEPEVKFINFSS